MISVIVPVYNVEKYIVKCLESILNQDYKDYELILVDDGSTDRSISVIKQYLADKEIDWKLIAKDNGGQSSARNAGLREAKGDYINFIDSDDVVSRDFLRELKNAIDENGVDFSFCNYEFVKTQGTIIDDNNEKLIYERNQLLEAFLKRNVAFVIPSMMFRKDYIKDNSLTFNEEIRFSEDQMFIWDVIFHSTKSVYLKKKMYGYFVREKSIMTSSPYKKIMKGFEVYKEYTDGLRKTYPEDKSIVDLILPRWELGTLFTAADLVSKEEFIRMYDAMDGRTIINRIKGIKESKAYLLSFVSRISKNIMYLLCKRMTHNG